VKKKGGTSRRTKRDGAFWNHNTVNQGLGKLQMEQPTEVIENTLEQMHLWGNKIVRNSQDQFNKNKTCEVNVIFSSDSISSLVVQRDSGAVMDLDFANIFDAVLCNILVSTAREKRTRKTGVEQSQLKEITSRYNSQ